MVEGLLASRVLVIESQAQIYEAMIATTEGLGCFAAALVAEVAVARGCTTTLTFDQGALRLPGFSAA